MDEMKAKLEALLRVRYLSRLGASRNEAVAEFVFAAHRDDIRQQIDAMVAESVATMDAATSARFAAYMLEQMDQEIGHMRAGNPELSAKPAEFRIVDNHD